MRRVPTDISSNLQIYILLALPCTDGIYRVEKV
jgi:hypothetical protein